MKRTWSRMHQRLTEDRGSIPMVMLIILLCVSLSAVLIPRFITQSNATRADNVRMHALNAAETGLQSALGLVRSAVNPLTGQGDRTKLPCGSQITGTVNDTSVNSDKSQYRVSLVYYDADPRGQSASWLAANLISCSSLATTTPSYVTFASTGTNNAAFGQPGDRTLTATYVIRTDNQNIPGGLIPNYYDGASSYLNLCMDAGSGNPTTGTTVTAQLCQNNVPDQQKFTYQNNLTIVLNASVTSTSPGLCLQADSSGVITLQTCITSTSSNASQLYTQQWSFNDNARFQATTSSGGLGSQCLVQQTQDFAGSALVLGSCSLPERQGAWLPTPAAGAGMAGPNTNQVVNFKQFGRCIDLQQFGLANPLIAWPCKQTPSGAPGWNQRWTYNQATKTLSMNYSSANGGLGNITTPYCALAPSSGASGPALRVKVEACPDPSAATPSELQWTSHTSSSDSYRDKYTYVDFAGRCLTPSSTDLYVTGAAANAANNVSYIVVAPCDGSLQQKWNGDPYVLLASPLRDANEK